MSKVSNENVLTLSKLFLKKVTISIQISSDFKTGREENKIEVLSIDFKNHTYLITAKPF